MRIGDSAVPISPELESRLRQCANTYDALSPTYHLERFGNRSGQYEFQESRALIWELLRRLAPQSGGAWRALDVATGTGKAAVTAAEIGGKVVALDAAEGMLTRCRQFSTEAGVSGRVAFTRSSAAALPFANETFDIVLSFRFLHLLPVSTYSSLLSEMARVTRPGGYVIVEVKNRWYGGLIYAWKDHRRRRRGETNFSSYVSPLEVAKLAAPAVPLKLHSYSGLLLPRSWAFSSSRPAAAVVRWLARNPLKWCSAHFVLVYQKTS